MVRAHPEFTPAYVALGEAAHELGHDQEAVSWLHDGFARTGAPVFLTRIEDHFLARQNPAGAIKAFRELAGQRKSDVLPRFFLGRLFSRLEMNDEAWEVFTELKAEMPDSPTLTYYIARVHERRSEYEEACGLYRGVVQSTEGLKMWYRCSGCGQEVAGWLAYCLACRAWDTFRVEWMEPTSPQDLDVAEVRPIWSAAKPAAEAL
jgi:lipopolysaccharide biosynthesis regulator YciM